MTRRSWILAGAGLFVALVLGIALGSGGDETPASPAVLNHIAGKNEDAATEAAARMKAKSETASEAADARQDVADDVASNAESTNQQGER
jgi:hypothetical protein